MVAVASSRLLTPYRAVGYITDGAPFAVNRLGEATFFTTTVGKAFQVKWMDGGVVVIITITTIINTTLCFHHQKPPSSSHVHSVI